MRISLLVGEYIARSSLWDEEDALVVGDWEQVITT